MDIFCAHQPVSGSADEPTMSNNALDRPVKLILSSEFMDTWTPLPDHSCQQMGTLGKITTHKVHRHNRLQLSTPDYKSATFAYLSEAQQFVEASQAADKAKLVKMLAAGTDANIADSKGRTALHVAASKGYTDIVTLLLKHNANPNFHDVNGNTPLHLAVCANHAVVMTLLISAGCKIDMQGRQGMFPISLVRNRMRRLQFGNKFTGPELQTTGSEKMKMFRQWSEEEKRSRELMVELSSLSLRVSSNQKDAEIDQTGEKGQLLQ